ncbi:MAG: glycogen synthase GlgA [Candidatus Omnitrophota bacterium]
MKTKILFVAAEAVPFFKTGGLADVIGSLPLVLADSGAEIKVFLPFYRRLANFENDCRTVLTGEIGFAGKNWKFQVLSFQKGPTEFLFCDVPELFDRESLYGPSCVDYPDNPLRFGFFSYAALHSLSGLKFQPDIIHCHDWHAALLPVYLKENFKAEPFYQKIKTIFTIHNLGYQGVFPKERWPMLSLPERLFNPEGLEFYGKINLLKAGLIWSDRITTVSPTYSREIRSKEFGQGLEGILQKRASDLSGILNGIDYQSWNPETDPLIAENYTTGKPTGKTKNKEILSRQFSFLSPEKPLLGVVSRLTPAKGFDLVIKSLPEIFREGFNLLILGSGLPEYETLFTEAKSKFKGSFGFQSGYNENLAHAIYAGADLFLMPSLFEPCGLGQMIALRYGTVPVVRRTGGLADSVFGFDGEKGNGFLFTEPSDTALVKTLQKVRAVFQNKNAWHKITANAFASDCSWSGSARQYLKLYGVAQQ